MLMPRSFRFHNIATRRTLGTACLISSRRLVARAAALSEMPVMLPPGCARLSIRRVATGSPTPTKTTFRARAGERGWKPAGDDHIHSITLHAVDNLAKLADLATRAARLEREVFAKCIAELLQLFQQNRPKRRFLV